MARAERSSGRPQGGRRCFVSFRFSRSRCSRRAWRRQRRSSSRAEAVAERSEIVVLARVTDIRSFIDGQAIATEVSLEVVDAIRGAAPGEALRVYELGGEVGTRRAWVFRDARLPEGRAGSSPSPAATRPGGSGRPTLELGIVPTSAPDVATAKSARPPEDPRLAEHRARLLDVAAKLERKPAAARAGGGGAAFAASRPTEPHDAFKFMSPKARLFDPAVPTIGNAGGALSIAAVRHAVAAWKTRRARARRRSPRLRARS